MKYKVGDKILVQGTVTKLDTRDCSLRLEFDDEVSIWLGENEILAFQNQDKTYEQGLQDAWEFMKKCFYSYTAQECEEIFGKVIVEHIVMAYTPQEALAKLNAYEEEQAIKVGDVVEYDSKKFVIVFVNGEFVNGIDSDGRFSGLSKDKCKKTGKHIDIESLLGQIGVAE